jgi:hypothetical protein
VLSPSAGRDWLLLTVRFNGQITSIALCVLTILMVRLGGEGRHSYDVTVEEAEFFSTALFANIQLAQTAWLFIKLSLAVFVRRLYTPSVSVAANRAFLAYIVCYIAFYVVTTVAIFLLCTPAAASWDLRVLILDHARCPHRATAGIAFTALTAASDVLLLFLAAFKIWFLRVPGRTRAGIMFLLSLGGLSVVCCLWRSVYITTAIDSLDLTCKRPLCPRVMRVLPCRPGSQTRVTILTMIETNVAIVTASLPACSVLFRNMIPKSLRSGSSNAAPASGSGEPDGEQGSELEDSEKADKAITREIRGSYIRDGSL